jgi:hypothetical protein
MPPDRRAIHTDRDENGFLLGKHTLWFSQEAYDRFDRHWPTQARTKDGQVITYTAFVVRDPHTDWRTFYRWKDAVVVGYSDEVNPAIERVPGKIVTMSGQARRIVRPLLPARFSLNIDEFEIPYVELVRTS